MQSVPVALANRRRSVHFSNCVLSVGVQYMGRISSSRTLSVLYSQIVLQLISVSLNSSTGCTIDAFIKMGASSWMDSSQEDHHHTHIPGDLRRQTCMRFWYYKRWVGVLINWATKTIGRQRKMYDNYGMRWIWVLLCRKRKFVFRLVTQAGWHFVNCWSRAEVDLRGRRIIIM